MSKEIFWFWLVEKTKDLFNSLSKENILSFNGTLWKVILIFIIGFFAYKLSKLVQKFISDVLMGIIEYIMHYFVILLTCVTTLSAFFMIQDGNLGIFTEVSQQFSRIFLRGNFTQ
jgi:hypothetical protein